MATHGLLSSDAPRLIEDSPIDEVSVKLNIYIQSYYNNYLKVISSKTFSCLSLKCASIKIKCLFFQSTKRISLKLLLKNSFC